MPDVCAVCGRASCDYPARTRDGQAFFEFAGHEKSLTKSQLASLALDHGYVERTGQLGTRPIPETPTSVPPPKRDWVLNVGMWLVLALMLAMAWYGIGCAAVEAATSPEAIERSRLAIRIAQCVEEALPSADSNAAKPTPGSSSPAAAVPSVVDAGAADSGIRGIDTADPWWVPDAGARPPRTEDLPAQPRVDGILAGAQQ